MGVHKTMGESSTCTIQSRPNLTSIYLNILSYFGAGIIMSSWTWNKASRDVWKRFIRKLCGLPTNKPVKLKKHKMIAQAFHKKQKKNGGGHDKLSIDFHTSHDDPLGMKFDMASVTSHDMSSAWMEAMPKLIQRRGGVALPVAGTLRRYSDSDISSIVASRRASIDSQISEAEKTLRVKVRKREGEHRSHRGLHRVNPADIHAFNAKRRGSNLSQKSIEHIRNHMSRRMSNTSCVSDASADSIKLDCNDDIDSRRTSIDGNTLPITQLQEMTLATYSMFTASALLPSGENDIQLDSLNRDSNSGHKHSEKQYSKRNNAKFRAQSSTSGRSSAKVHTPTNGYVNDALDDGDISDVSI